MADAPHFKNIVYGTIHANGNVHIGDIVYNIAADFQHSILFLKIEKTAGGTCALSLSIKSKHATKGGLAANGENLLREAVQVDIPPHLFEAMKEFQAFRRQIDAQTRYKGQDAIHPYQVQAAEAQLSALMYQTFFSGEIGQVCADFIGLLHEGRIEELLLAIACGDEEIINLPFEMALPLFSGHPFYPQGRLASAKFGLVRTKASSLSRFDMAGRNTDAAPLKMLFITALPEDLAEGGKMLQIEEEQTRLIRAIGALEATGDLRPKIAIEFLENASLAELDKALEARHHDIVHISGHGAYKAEDKKGVLFFEDEDGDEVQVSGKALGQVLQKHGCVKLLLLSACETAVAGAEGGVTEQVADCGMPAIVAMRFAVTDEGAKVFTTALYTHLAKGDTVTQSVAYARDALEAWVADRRQNAPQIVHIAEWFTPVVYQNQYMAGLIADDKPYRLPEDFYPKSSFLKTRHTRLIGEGFIGRKGYLIQLRQAFRANKHVVLQGMGGLGKTTLAEAFAHHYAGKESGTVMLFRNGHQINETFILDKLNTAFGKAHPQHAEQMQEIMDNPDVKPNGKLQYLLDNYLRHRRTILVFDNFEDVQQTAEGELLGTIASRALSDFLRYFCENAPQGCHLLFTTRYAIPDLADCTLAIPLGKMGYAEQYRLLNYSETLRGIPLADRDDVYRRLDGHPRGYQFLEALMKKDKSFDWAQVAKVEADVFEDLLLAKVYERLSAEEQPFFQVAAVFTTTTPLAALAQVLDKSPEGITATLRSLSDWSLLYLDENRRTFDVHRLTREWMREQVIPAPLRREVAEGAGHYFESQPTVGDYELAREYFEIAEAWEEFAEVTFGLDRYYERIGMNQRVVEINQAVLEKNIDQKTNSQAINNLGILYFKTGNHDDALKFFEQGLAIKKEIGDRQGEGTTLNNISQIYKAKGDYDTALDYLEKSLDIQQEVGDRQGEGTTLNNLATIALAKGDYAKALDYLEKSLVIRQEVGDRRGEGITMNNISQIYDAKGDYAKALDYLGKSLIIQQEIGDRRGEGTTLNNISQIHRAKGDYDTALDYLEKSLVITQEVGDRRGEGVTLNNISQIYHAKGDYDTALDYLEKSLVIRQEIGDIAGLAATLNNMGAIFLNQKNDIEKATLTFFQSYQINQKLGSPNVKMPAAYLNKIIEQIGEERFQEIIAKAG